jgi:DNA-binding NarL/FixJ family response regulator
MVGDAATEAALKAGSALRLDDAIAEALDLGEGSLVPRMTDESDPYRPSPTSGSLTSREQDVLRLLATGRTDREIAETLFLSRRTVNVHAASIRNKLGVSNRRDAVTQARERGLLPTHDLPPKHT